MNRLSPFASIFLLIILTFGCAKKDWRDPLQEEESETMRTTLMSDQELLKECPSCIDAEIAATWNSQLYDGGINGYMQLLLPSSAKIIAINPLGQPVFALTTDGYRFQTINAVKGVYKHGKLASFVERHSLPKGVLEGNWASWLSGSFSFTSDELKEIRQDISSRGVWLTIEKVKTTLKRKEYLLYEPLTKKILERVPISRDGNEIARIIYNDWIPAGQCAIPTTIDIRGKSVGTDISIKLSKILTNQQYTSDDFYLKLPPGYLQQYYP